MADCPRQRLCLGLAAPRLKNRDFSIVGDQLRSSIAAEVLSTPNREPSLSLGHHTSRSTGSVNRNLITAP